MLVQRGKIYTWKHKHLKDAFKSGKLLSKSAKEGREFHYEVGCPLNSIKHP